jgi:phospholipid-translocating ATPase
VTGVEDKLQDGVRNSLETLRNANIKLVMLTGDQQQTAICIGISCGLIEKNQPIFAFQGGSQREILRQLDSYGVKAASTALVIDGATLQVCLDQFESQFVECLCAAPAVICCRCSPQQKADIVKLVKRYSGGATVAAIGDGGNDTNMITQADVGLGIVGKEGMQASLAADYSLTQFSHCCRLILWHGRNSYQRSARLSQFVIHRGIIISIVQAVFSALFFYATIPIFSGWLVVGYATAYTMLPVFALVLDEDVDSEKVFLYPELYKELQRGRPLSFKTFSLWLFQSIYQGGCIMMLAIVLFESNFLHIVSIAFTSLIACELLNVALEVHRWHRLMVAAQLASVAIYLVSLIALKSYFDISFILTFSFFWKVTVITLIASMPPAAAKWIQVKCNPQAHTKVNE